MIKKNSLTTWVLCCFAHLLLTSFVFSAGSFNFNDGTTQGWTLDQMYVTATYTKFTPLSGYTLMNSNTQLLLRA
jgi:hypothetical protein